MDIKEMNLPEIKVQLDRFENEVKEYEKQPIEMGKIMFLGSSGFTRWSTKFGNIPLEECVVAKDGSKVAQNRGVGGSTMEEILYYYPRLVRPYKPKALIVSSCINDRPCGYTPDEMVSMLARLFAYARVDMPGIKLYVTDVRPNAKHIGVYDETWDNYTKGTNEALRKYCENHDDVTFIELSKEPMYYNNAEDVGNYFKVRRDIFIDDLMHFTPEGYRLFTDAFKRILDDIL